MNSLSNFNELLIKLNRLDVDFNRIVRFIDDSKLITIDINNPIPLVRKALYSLKEMGEKNNFDMFSDKTYIKFIYLSYFEATIHEMSMCLSNIVNYIDSGILERLRYRKLVERSIKKYNEDFFMLEIFEIDFVLEYYKMMLQSEGYFDFFKPGMYYKYLFFVLKEMQQMKIEEDKEPYEFIKNFTRFIEDELEKKSGDFDYSSLDDKIEEISQKYCVDFVSLDRDFTFQVRGLDDEENGENLRNRK